MGSFAGLLEGLHVAMAPGNLALCLLGVFVGTLIGVLPGVGPASAIALLLPATFGLPPEGAFIMLAGVYYGAMYGGSTTSILLGVPGEAASIVTCLDGHAMAKNGRAGAALGISAIGSFIAGTLGVIFLSFLAPSLVQIALGLGPPEQFALVVLGLTTTAQFSSGSKMNALVMAVLGLLCATIGTDAVSGRARFTFGTATLADGVGVVPVALGLFGVADVLGATAPTLGTAAPVARPKLRELFPSRDELRRSVMPILRASIIGFVLGVLPGAGGILSPFVSYAVERRLSKTPERFGTGMVEGVAGPESANNAAAAGAFIPLLTLGLASNPVTAILLGALMIHGLQPGPMLVKQSPGVFWGVVTSMYIGNVFLLLLNMPLIGAWVRIAQLPRERLYPIVLMLSVAGAYAASGNTGDALVVCVAGILGHVARSLRYEATPFVLALALGPTLEEAFRQSLIVSGGDFRIFVVRPIAAALLVAAVAPPILRLLRAVVARGQTVR